jgi:NTE family protein
LACVGVSRLAGTVDDSVGRTWNSSVAARARDAAVFGASGFFSARPLAPWLQAGGTLAATSIYDTRALKTTLERLVDFDRINAGMTRFSAGAVNVRTGNLVYFDTATHTIRPEHVLASGALPPGFPAVEIDDEH